MCHKSFLLKMSILLTRNVAENEASPKCDGRSFSQFAISSKPVYSEWQTHLSILIFKTWSLFLKKNHSFWMSVCRSPFSVCLFCGICFTVWKTRIKEQKDVFLNIYSGQVWRNVSNWIILKYILQGIENKRRIQIRKFSVSSKFENSF